MKRERAPSWIPIDTYTYVHPAHSTRVHALICQNGKRSVAVDDF